MQELRMLLLPFSWLYGLILSLRHFLYDKGILKSYAPSQKTIVVGNLSLGGTGKTPLADYLVTLLGMQEMALLSRGYGRKTSGTVVVRSTMDAGECGDEPLLLKNRHPELLVVVDENRARGLEFLKSNYPDIKTVVLDDAMQHRKIRGDFYLLLTTWANPFHEDFLLPAGNLRDLKGQSKRAHAIVVTKTPSNCGNEAKSRLASSLKKPNQKIFFSTIEYGEICDLNSDRAVSGDFSKVVLVSAIAAPLPFEKEVQKNYHIVRHFEFKDHHIFTHSELVKLRDFIDTFGPEKPVILTTEKDAQRLKPHVSFFHQNEVRVYYWKIKTDFGADAERFNSLIRSV